MQQVELSVVSRATGEKSAIKKLRGQGMIPANIYGPGSENVFCSFSEREFRAALKNNLSSNCILNLKAQDGTLNGKKVILKNLEREPASWKINHADLYEVSMTRPLTVNVPLTYSGTPEGVKNEGGILQVIRRSVSIRALATDIPDSIDVDISALGLGDSLHVGEVKFSDKLKVLDDKKFTIVAVVEAEKEEVVEVAAAAPGEGAAAAAGTGAAAAGTGTAAASGTAAGAKPAAGGDKKEPAKPAK